MKIYGLDIKDFFALKAECSNCGKTVGWTRYRIADGWLCPECLRLCDTDIVNARITKRTLAEVRENIAANHPEIRLHKNKKQVFGENGNKVFCTECGNSLEHNALFCGNCGEKIG